MAEQEPTSEHHYPHEGHLEQVAPEVLAEDLTQHPEAYHPDLVTNHINPFLAMNGLHMTLLEQDDVDLVRETMRKFHNWKDGDELMSEADAYVLLDEQYYGYIAGNFNKFTPLHKYFAHTLIDMGYAKNVAEHLDAFTDLDAEIAEELLDSGYVDNVLRHLEYFNGYTTDDVFEALIQGRLAYAITQHLDLFTGMSHSDIARQLIDRGKMGTLTDYIDSFRNLDTSVAYRLIDAGRPQAVLHHFKRYPGLDTNEVAHRLMDTGKSNLLVQNLPDFEELDAPIAYYLIDQTYGRFVMANLKQFRSIDYDRLVSDLIYTRQVTALIENLDLIPDVDYTNIALKIIATGGLGSVVVENIDKFPGVDLRRIFDALWAEGNFIVLIRNFNKFYGLGMNQDEIVRDIIKGGYAIEAARNIAQFPDVDHRKVVQEIIDVGYAHTIFSFYDNFHDIDDMDIIGQVLRQDVMNIRLLPPSVLERMKKKDAFRALIKENVSQIFTAEEEDYYDDKAADSYSRLARILKPGDNEIVDLNSELFGPMAGATTARIVYGIMQREQMPEFASEVGITQGGPEGIEQLKALMEPIVRELITGDLSPETERQFAESELLKRVLMSYTGYGSARWGGHDADALTRKLEYRALARKDGRISNELQPGYEPSEHYQITKGDHETEFTEDTIKRYGVLLKDIQDASVTLERPDGFTEFVRAIQDELDVIIENLDAQMVAVDENDEKADLKLENLEKRINSLRQYMSETREGAGKRFVLNSPADFARGIVELAAYPELHAKIRTLTFAWAMRKNPHAAGELSNLAEQPTIKSISAMREFVEHIVNQETYGDYFSDKKSLGVFKRITSVRALDEALVRYNKLAAESGILTGIQFVPTRGLLLDLSGQIANACWADVNKSLAEDRSNFTAIIMREQPGEADERIVGAALLIETKDPKTGDGVLLLRGVNPVESYINKIDVSGFYDAVTDFVRKTAKRRGLKPAIVIDDHVGGSGTNRSVLHDYLMIKGHELKPQRVDNATTLFNGYDVTQKSYKL